VTVGKESPEIGVSRRRREEILLLFERVGEDSQGLTHFRNLVRGQALDFKRE
jgi:hypothetical protein